MFRWWFAVTVLALASQRLFAQGVEEQTDSSRMTPTARAVLRTSDIDIDGQLTEPAWSDAQVASGFVQREPVEGNLVGTHDRYKLSCRRQAKTYRDSD